MIRGVTFSYITSVAIQAEVNEDIYRYIHTHKKKERTSRTICFNRVRVKTCDRQWLQMSRKDGWFIYNFVLRILKHVDKHSRFFSTCVELYSFSAAHVTIEKYISARARAHTHTHTHTQREAWFTTKTILQYPSFFHIWSQELNVRGQRQSSKARN
jgi:hypothetical protein